MADDDTFEVVVSSGRMRPASGGVVMPHRWTDGGVTIECEFTGAHLLHVAVAGCVLNDVYRESARLGIVINGVRVSARGGFDTSTWVSTGVTYDVEVDSDSDDSEIAKLIEVVDDVAEIPRALRSGTSVTRLVTPPAGRDNTRSQHHAGTTAGRRPQSGTGDTPR